MDADKLAKLRAIADATTRGDWLSGGGDIISRAPTAQKFNSQTTIVSGSHDDTGEDWANPADLTFIATFNPSVVKAMLDVVEAASARPRAIDSEMLAAGLRIRDALAALAEKIK